MTQKEPIRDRLRLFQTRRGVIAFLSRIINPVDLSLGLLATVVVSESTRPTQKCPWGGEEVI